MKLPRLSTSAAIACLALCAASWSGTAQAAVIFADNFNAETPGLNVGLTNFSVAGSIDVIPTAGNYDFYPGNGEYVDLDGTPSSTQTPASVVTSNTLFGPGTYTVSFNLGGNARGYGAKTTEVTLGGTTLDFTLASGAGFTTQSFTATVTGAPTALRFTELGSSDNVGNVLDNVSVSSVPLPAALPLFGAALFGLGAFGYGMKRKNKAAA